MNIEDKRLEELFDSIELDETPGMALEAFREVSAKLGFDEAAIAERARKNHRTYIIKRSLRIAYRVAAILFVPLATIMTIMLVRPKTEPVRWTEVVVPSGETREIVLPDGTSCRLNAGSRITYPESFTGDERHVFLDGEIFAEVTHDEAHPFIIESGDLTLAVLGTTVDFKSYRDSRSAEVNLVEGGVDLSFDTGLERRDVRLSPGDIVQLDRKTATFDLSHFSTEDYAPFDEDGQINFSNLPLGDIAQDLSRIFGEKVYVEDSSLADTRFIAFFNNGESLEAILSALCSSGGMKVRKHGEFYAITKK
ncbi:MAG: FecR domain-containing protein [Bacteroidales bacterium]|nr:FecR domain-containing protein [Bacteroidales bacterium]